MSTAGPVRGSGQGYWQDADMPGLGEAGPQAAEDGAADGMADGAARLKKAPHAFRTISEVADELHVPQHVLRFWETRFTQVRPLKRGGGRRYYRPDDIELLRRIADLLYVQGYTIKGVQRMLREGDTGVPTTQAAPESGEGEDLFLSPDISVVPEDESGMDEARGGSEAVRGEEIEMTLVHRNEAAPPAQSPEDAAADAAEIERILSENQVLKENLRGILVELRALRRLIPV
ncbi:MerR family transcriptional regulator [Gluconacetobacter diazotrophicus]|uniref:MerR family transcriptional regulator n=2 Tax=Gluconacetobacter diazotrophicus TaxID=33996 RepID=A0A7W4I6H3_GLUDI|nr:MerR family transcriptional regulator [Gluconacetobacter diazotrophicus]MBB2157165.1 MerR family transcriptional regulator [Gluconacetobacter diazotrophicus]CAP57016.1 putative transcriptional regulatory protein, MerR family [Gluconacetobacter diazotrophicus PA1 5]